jgi:hypothetical protein
MSFHTGAMWDRSPLSNVGISVVYATIGALASDAWSFIFALPWP